MGMMAVLTFASFQLSLQTISYLEIWIIFQLEMGADETSSSREGPTLSAPVRLSGSELTVFS